MAMCAVLLESGAGGGRYYDLLWVAVFGFATLNILSLVARRFEPGRSSMSFGEVLAITTAVICAIMLGWELLFMFHILPIRIQPR